MMRIKAVFLTAVLAVLTASTAQAASTITVIGRHPFCKPPLASVADLKTMMATRTADVELGLRKAGYPELAQPLKEQFPSAFIRSGVYVRGTTFKWMLFKGWGTGPVLAAADITYDGRETVTAYEFSIDHDQKRYTFAVPLKCGNLALLEVKEL
ncbi:MAG: hypothetical protein ABFS19_07895 [Thermodesulfobacteriota bacterium]